MVLSHLPIITPVQEEVGKCYYTYVWYYSIIMAYFASLKAPGGQAFRFATAVHGISEYLAANRYVC